MELQHSLEGSSLFTQTGFHTRSILANSGRSNNNQSKGAFEAIIHHLRQYSWGNRTTSGIHSRTNNFTSEHQTSAAAGDLDNATTTNFSDFFYYLNNTVKNFQWNFSLNYDSPTPQQNSSIVNVSNDRYYLNDRSQNTMPYVLNFVSPQLWRNATAFQNDSWSAPNDSSLLRDRGSGYGQVMDSKFPMFVIYGICIPLISITGILLNLASLIVLTRRSMRSSVNIYLAGLSFFDGFLLLIALLTFPPVGHCEYYGSNSFWCDFLRETAQVTYPLLNIMQTGSIWTVTAITIDRFMAIMWPLKSRKYLTIQRAVVTLTIILAWAIIYNVPSFFELERVNNTLGATKLRENTLYIAVYKSYCYLFLMFLIPACLMITLNIFVTLSVKHAYMVRRQMSGRDEKERRCTVMAVLVVSTFLILNLTANITNCIEAFASLTFAPLVWTSNLLVTINSAINFFIYCALSLKFRQMFCKLFCPLCYTSEKEYKFLSAYFGTMRVNMAGGGGRGGGGGGGGLGPSLASRNDRHNDSCNDLGQFNRGVGPSGIISMRSLTKPLINSPRGSSTRSTATTTTAHVGRSGGRTNQPQTSPRNVVQISDRRQFTHRPPAYD